MPSPRAGPSAQLLRSASRLPRRRAHPAAAGLLGPFDAAQPRATLPADAAEAVPAFLVPAFFTSTAPPAWRSHVSAFSPRPSPRPLRLHARSVHDAAAVAAPSPGSACLRKDGADESAPSPTRAALSRQVAIDAERRLRASDHGSELQARIRRSAAGRGLFDEPFDPFVYLRACVCWLATDVVEIIDELAESTSAESAGRSSPREKLGARARREEGSGLEVPARVALPDDEVWPTSVGSSPDLTRLNARATALELKSSASDQVVAKLLSRFTLAFWRHDALGFARMQVQASEGVREGGTGRTCELWSPQDMQQLDVVAQTAERQGHRLALLVLGRHCRRWMYAATLDMKHKRCCTPAELEDVRAVLLALRSINSRVVCVLQALGHWASVAEHTEAMRLFVGEIGSALNDHSLADECLDLNYFRASLSADAALREPLEPEDLQLRRQRLRPDEQVPPPAVWWINARAQRRALMHAAHYGKTCAERLDKLCRALRRSRVQPDHRFMRQLFDSLARRMHPPTYMLAPQAPLTGKEQDIIVSSRRWRVVRDQVRSVARSQWQYYRDAAAVSGATPAVARTLVALMHLELAIIEPVLHAMRSVPSLRGEVDSHVANLLGLTSQLSALYHESPSDAMTELRRKVRSHYFALRLLLASGHSEAAMREFVSMLRVDLGCFAYDADARRELPEGAHAPGSPRAHRIKSGIHQLQRSAFVAALSHALHRESDRALLLRVLRLGRAAVSRGTFNATNRFKEQAAGQTRDNPSDLAYFWGRTLGVILPAHGPNAADGETAQLRCLPDEVMDELTLTIEAMDVAHTGLSRRTRSNWRLPFQPELLKRERVEAFVCTALKPLPEPVAAPQAPPTPVPQWATWLLGNAAPDQTAPTSVEGQGMSDSSSPSTQLSPGEIMARFQAITRMLSTLHADEAVWARTREVLAVHLEPSPRSALDYVPESERQTLKEKLLGEVDRAEHAAEESRQLDERLAAPAINEQRAAALERAGLTLDTPRRERVDSRDSERQYLWQLAEDAFDEVTGTTTPAARQPLPDHSGKEALGELQPRAEGCSKADVREDEGGLEDETVPGARASLTRYALGS